MDEIPSQTAEGPPIITVGELSSLVKATLKLVSS